jgi:YVTN family beta-propeller protein
MSVDPAARALVSLRRLAVVAALVLVMAGLPSHVLAHDDEHCFEETGNCVDGRVQEFWERNGGVEVFGRPIGGLQQEQVGGRLKQAQWFERARIELHPEQPQPYDVQLGRVGAERLGQQGRNWFALPKAAPTAGCRTFAGTGHQVCEPFLAAWRERGVDLDGNNVTSERESLALFGMPLSEPQPEMLDGREVVVQWFERARFELHPRDGAPAEVHFGLLGSALRSGPRGRVWITNRDRGEVAVLDAGTGEVLGTTPVGKDPIGVISPNGSGKIYVTNEGGNSVSVIDMARRAVVATIPTGPRPHHIAASPNGRFVYFGEFGTNKVGVIDTQRDALVAEYVSGPPEARTHAVSVTSDGKTLLVTNDVSNTIAALDAQSGAIKWSVAAGSFPYETVPDNAGKVAYASIRRANSLAMIDLDGQQIVREVPIGTEPVTLQLTANGKLLVVALRSRPAALALVDTDTLGFSLVNLPGAAGHNWLSSNGRFSFVAIEASVPGIAVVEHETRQVVAYHPYPGEGRPHGVFVEPGQGGS